MKHGILEYLLIAISGEKRGRERHFVYMSFFFIIVQSIFRRERAKKKGGSLYTANEQQNFFLQDLSSVGYTFTVPHDDTLSQFFLPKDAFILECPKTPKDDHDKTTNGTDPQ